MVRLLSFSLSAFQQTMILMLHYLSFKYYVYICSFCDTRYFSIVYVYTLVHAPLCFIPMNNISICDIQSKRALSKRLQSYPSRGITYSFDRTMYVCLCIDIDGVTYGFHISYILHVIYNSLSFGHDMLYFHHFHVCFYELRLDRFYSLVEKKRAFTLVDK